MSLAKISGIWDAEKHDRRRFEKSIFRKNETVALHYIIFQIFD